MEAKWGLEIADGALGMSREEANEFVKKIQVPREKLEIQLKGKGFQESYDLNKLTPNAEYQEIYESAKRQLSDLGFSFRTEIEHHELRL
jgi:methylamine--corrinoid protein Co-methyltransferase